MDPIQSDSQATFRFDTGADTLFCAFPGNQNGHAAQKSIDLTMQALEEYPKTRQVVFDLAETSFISSMFLRLCIMMLRRFGVDGFFVINTTGDVRGVFDLSGLSNFVSCEET
jgi:anti-anti-sigma regulatory factor